MARKFDRLTAGTVAKAKKVGMYADGGGLYMQIAGENSRSWIFRYTLGTNPATGKPRTREMGLGSVSTFGLAEARQKARDCRQLLHDGIDPIAARDAARDKATLEAAKAVTFKVCGERYIKAHEAGWRNEKHAGQWTATLDTYAYPIIGALSVQSVDTGLVLKVLEPIWTTKTETASRVRGRIESVLAWATTRGYRQGDNPARWKGHLENLLPKRSKVAKVEHFSALPYAELPAFMETLRAQTVISARALEFAILTAARTGETIGGRLAEIDLAEKLWIVPAERMKAGKEHRVPLSAPALAIIERMKAEGATDHLFPGGKPGKPLSNMAMLELLRRMGRKDLTVHGFRSAFSDWVAERTHFPSEVREMALAHAVEDKVEAAYRRGDLLERRRQLMDAWARYCTSPAVEQTGEVISLAAVG